jgi:YidC/Oxa1 family membrane protein insertase
MNDLARLFTALILSLAAVFLWNYMYVTPKLEKAKAIEQAQQAAQVQPVVQQQVQPVQAVNPIEKLTSEVTAFNAILSREDALKQSPRIRISTERVHGSINLVGGMVDDLTLAKYRQELKDNSPEVVLLSPRKTKELYFINTGWLSANSVPDDNTVWQRESGNELTINSPVTIKYESNGLVFRKTFSIDDKYLITVKQSVQNKTSAAVTLSPFGLINRTYDLNKKGEFVSHEGFVAVADKKLNETDYSALVDEEAPETFSQVSGWVGISDKYWISSIIPQNSATDKFDIAFKHYQKDGLERFQADILSAPISLAAGASVEYTFNIFSGAKKLSFIEEHEAKLGIDLFDRSIDFGSLYFLTKPIFKMLTYFHDEIGNMGFAIMLLTVVIRLILFPLANMSFKSMARMKKHMPEITALKERFKNDKQKMGQEMMKYYKSHKINPAAGCLPILLQIPVFFALYKVLYVTIEMRHEPFIWFIKDLSAHDPTNILTLFGLLAWNVPAWLPHIGILPILFSLSMVVQQKLNPPMADETQKLIMAWMPWIFLFVFANFAAGLVIYWIWNNILSIIQQAIITRKIEEDKNE